MATFVLIHGGGHGGWCWDHIVSRLTAAGHRVLAPDLPGMNGDPTPLADINLSVYGEFVADIIRREPEPVLLVGHSMGGMSISEAAERVPERILGLVYVTAVLVPPGQSMLGFSGGQVPVDRANLSADGVALELPAAAARHMFFNRTEPELAEWAVARICLQPLSVMKEPLSITPERFGTVPRAFVECLDDNSKPITLQRRQLAAMPCDPVYTMDTDHSPFFSDPDTLTEHLLDALHQFEQRKAAA